MLHLVHLHMLFPLNGIASSCPTPPFPFNAEKLALLFQDWAHATSSVNLA